MPEWNMNVQRIIDLAERGLRGELTLECVSRRLGYSPWYCTRQFTRVTGMSLRTYLRMRRLSEAAIQLRDTDRGILDIAVEFGFSSQEAFTRAFRDAWGCAPGAWRSSGRPLGFMPRLYAFVPAPEGGKIMRNLGKTGVIDVSVQSVPARRFIGVKVADATDYLDMWKRLESEGSDCRKVEGTLAAVSANAQIGGWYGIDGKEGYLYGVEVPADYSETAPEGMVSFDVPASEYIVFHHPPYDFESRDAEVWAGLRAAMAAFDPSRKGYRWNHEIPIWQRHDPEGMGQAWCRAVMKR